MLASYIEQGNLDLGIVHTHLALIEGVKIPRAEPPALAALRSAALENAAAYTEEELANNTLLQGHRSLLRHLGYSKRKARPAPERLIRSTRKRGWFPKISPPVDCYNTVVVERCLGVGAHDADKIISPILFTRALGHELFTPILRQKPAVVPEGDYIYRDQIKVLGRLACEDCDEAKITEKTTRILLVSEGNPGCTPGTVFATIKEAADRIVTFCAGHYTIWTPETIEDGSAVLSQASMRAMSA